MQKTKHMLSKAKINLIRSLNSKKIRDETKLFIAEGEKILAEILNQGIQIKYLFYCGEKTNFEYLKSPLIESSFELKDSEMQKISLLKTPAKYLAVLHISRPILNINQLRNKITLAFEDIQDPGNLGTIIRICDWFGIENIVLSHNSADIYSPKVIQASMGSFLRVNAFYTDLNDFITSYKNQSGHECYGTFISGKNIYECDLSKSALIVFGNEGNGITESLEKLIDYKIQIPTFNKNQDRCESLNVASATAIICSEFFRRN